MRTSHRWLAVAALAFSFAAACGGGGDGGPAGPGGGSAAFTARIDGQAWASDASLLTATVGSVPGSLVLTGTRLVSTTNYTTIGLILSFIGAPGTYPLGVNPGTSAGGQGTLTITAGPTPAFRETDYSGNAGTVTITSLTSTRMAGTFNFTAIPIPGSMLVGAKVVTNGTFDVALPAGFTSVPAANHGSKVSATIAGVSWNGATVAGQGSGGAFTLSGLSTDYFLAVSTSVVVTAGTTYNLGSGVALDVTEVKTGHDWGGIPTDVGTVTISSLAGNRAVGTFAGSLTPGFSSPPGALVITGGTFDVRIDAH